MPGRSIGDLYHIAKAAYDRKGIRYLIQEGAKQITNISSNYILLSYYKTFRSSASFEFMGRRYNYFYHPYGPTWRNERAVEIPIVWDIVITFMERNKKILEVGNVLSYRFNVIHDIVDKYDKKKGVVNQDIVDFRSQYKYDLIICISTLEHVGWDESSRDTTKVLRAVDNLRSMIRPGGKIVVTIPLGYNPNLDTILRTGKIKFKRQYYLKRTGKLEWKQADSDDMNEASYDFDIPSARALMIGIDEI